MRIALPRRLSLLASFTAAALALAACSTAADPGATTTASSAPSTSTMPSDGHMDGHDEEFAFGMPADPADSDRTIEIAARDISFDPANITIHVGETVTFVVVNHGVLPHDFLLGTAEMQDEHEAEMASGMAGMHDDPNAFVLAVAETGSLTWTFTEVGEVLFGCHQTGHYAAGMVGTITVVE